MKFYLNEGSRRDFPCLCCTILAFFLHPNFKLLTAVNLTFTHCTSKLSRHFVCNFLPFLMKLSPCDFSDARKCRNCLGRVPSAVAKCKIPTFLSFYVKTIDWMSFWVWKKKKVVCAVRTVTHTTSQPAQTADIVYVLVTNHFFPSQMEIIECDGHHQ